MLVGLDGAKALRKAVVDVLDHPVIRRCQLHKLRDVKDHVPQRLRRTVGRGPTDAYHADSALQAEAVPPALAKEIDCTHSGAAASLREGLDETLTVLRLVEVHAPQHDSCDTSLRRGETHAINYRDALFDQQYIDGLGRGA